MGGGLEGGGCGVPFYHFSKSHFSPIFSLISLLLSLFLLFFSKKILKGWVHLFDWIGSIILYVLYFTIFLFPEGKKKEEALNKLSAIRKSNSSRQIY